MKEAVSGSHWLILVVSIFSRLREMLKPRSMEKEVEERDEEVRASLIESIRGMNRKRQDLDWPSERLVGEGTIKTYVRRRKKQDGKPRSKRVASNLWDFTVNRRLPSPFDLVHFGLEVLVVTKLLNQQAKSSNGLTGQGQLQSSQLSKNPKEDTQRSADSLGGFPDSSSQGKVEWSTRKKRKSRIPQKSATLKRWIIDMNAPAQGDLLTDYQDSMVVNKSSAQGHSPFTTELINQANTLVKRLDRHELRDAMAGIPCPGLLGTSQSQYQHDEAGRRHADLPSTPRVDNAGDLIARVSSESRKIETALPFEKRSPVWKYIDLEITPKVGQHPHFWPLSQFPEVEREGIAVGLMLTYESLMSNKNRLKMDSSCQILDEYLKIVVALEEHGFEVQHTRAQLEELRRAKGNHTQLLQKKSVTEALTSEVKEKIDRQNAELDLTDNAIMALNQVLGHFNDRRTSLSKRKDENETLSAELQKYLWVAEEELMSTERTLQDLLNAV